MELEALRRGERVAEELCLPGGCWRAVIVPGDGLTAMALADGYLHLALSRADCERLADPGTEGVYFHLETGPRLRYFVEKDFPCVHPRAPEAREAEGETFAPPEGFAERHSRTC